MNRRVLGGVLLVMVLAACERGAREPEESEEEAQTSREPATMTDVTNSVRMVNAQGETIGYVQLSEEAEGVRLALQLSGLTPGSTHGLHIHERGMCEAPNFESAGGHFNPTGRQHGFANAQGPHAGDLPNITVTEDSTLVTNVLAQGVVRGEAPNGLRHPGGTALVIHENADDYVTNPSGNSGARIACGVISTGPA